MPLRPEDLRTGGALQGAVADSLLRQHSAADELARGQRIGAWRVLGEIGRGGMAIVYRAERADGEYQQQVALKWMQGARLGSDAEALFRRERQALADLSHPHIARLLDGGCTAEGRLWFAMEHITGAPLDRYCVEAGLLLAQRLALFLQLCAAVGFAHAHGIIHRDIKPSNVLVDREETVKLLDFGIARLLGEDDRLGEQACTPGFASPEQREGKGLTVASDVFQLGRTLQRLLADLPRLPGGGDLPAIVACACADEPGRRYASVSLLAADLEAYLQRRPLAARTRRPLYLVRCLARRRPWAIGLSLATLLAVLAGTLIFTWRLAEERDRARLEAERALAGQDFLVSLFRAADPGANPGQPISTRALLDRGVALVEAQTGAAVHARNQQLQILARVSMSLGDFDRAQSLLDRGFAESDDPVMRLPLWTLQLALLQRRGSTARAVELAPAIIREVPAGAAFDALRARALNTAARAAAQTGDPRAPDWLAQALDAALRAGDLGQQGYGWRTRAFLQEQAGDDAAALASVERALAALIAALGKDAPEVFSARSHRVHLMLELGRAADALAEAESIHEAARPALAREHAAAIYAEGIRALALLANQRFEEANDVAEGTARRCRAALGAGHAHCGNALHAQGRALDALGRPDASLPVWRELLENRRASMGEAHLYTAFAKLRLGQALCSRGAADEGRPLVEQAAQHLHGLGASIDDREAALGAHRACGIDASDAPAFAGPETQ